MDQSSRFVTTLHFARLRARPSRYCIRASSLNIGSCVNGNQQRIGLLQVLRVDPRTVENVCLDSVLCVRSAKTTDNNGTAGGAHVGVLALRRRCLVCCCPSFGWRSVSLANDREASC
jgi:hypothetical protein